MLTWLARWWKRWRSAASVPPVPPLPASQEPPPAPREAGAAEPKAPARTQRSRLAGKVENLDQEQHRTASLRAVEQEAIARVAARVEKGDFELPMLPSSSMVAIEMAASPTVDVSHLVTLISTDPVLSTELMKAANSVIYGGSYQAETLSQAVVRVGTRTLRSLIYSLSVRGVIFRNRGLGSYAEELWRQAYSVARISQLIAEPLRLAPEKCFLLGLLHDMGKISLLAMLGRECTSTFRPAAHVVGRVFHEFHERAGVAMAREWKLPEEFISVSGCHHHFEQNPDFPRSAALVSLAHKLDLHLSLGEKGSEYQRLARCPEMRFLGLADHQRAALLESAEELFRFVPLETARA